MKLSELLSRLCRWRSQQSLVDAETLQRAESESIVQVERSVLKKGRLLLKEWKYLDEQEQRFREKRQELQEQLQVFIQDSSLSEELYSGETWRLDLSQQDSWRVLVEEIRLLLDSPALLSQQEKPDQRLLALPRFDRESLKKPIQQLYDVKNLEEESDELLHYL